MIKARRRTGREGERERVETAKRKNNEKRLKRDARMACHIFNSRKREKFLMLSTSSSKCKKKLRNKKERAININITFAIAVCRCGD